MSSDYYFVFSIQTHSSSTRIDKIKSYRDGTSSADDSVRKVSRFGGVGEGNGIGPFRSGCLFYHHFAINQQKQKQEDLVDGGAI